MNNYKKGKITAYLLLGIPLGVSIVGYISGRLYIKYIPLGISAANSLNMAFIIGLGLIFIGWARHIFKGNPIESFAFEYRDRVENNRKTPLYKNKAIGFSIAAIGLVLLVVEALFISYTIGWLRVLTAVVLIFSFVIIFLQNYIRKKK